MSNPLTQSEEQKLIERITNLICDEGMNKEKILKIIASEYLLEQEAINDKIEIVISQLNEKYNDPEYRKSIILDHIAKYEEIYAYFKRINHAQGANRALQAKEKLLNILKEGNRISLKRSETIIHQTTVVPEYDINQLNPDEQERLKYLLNKACS